MSKKILITGSTDGIGFETAKMLLEQGHHVLLHGRTLQDVQRVEPELAAKGSTESYIADLSDFNAVRSLAKEVAGRHTTLDILINNAGVFKVPNPIKPDGFDLRFIVNTVAPYLLTKELLPLLGDHGRVVNLSSAAQAPVDLDALVGKGGEMDDMNAYSQSKLALIMWIRAMTEKLGDKGPMIVAVNPGSLLATNMVKQAFGVEGKDVSIGANIVLRAALSDEFTNARGRYFDNDAGQFADPNADALSMEKCKQVVDVLEKIIS